MPLLTDKEIEMAVRKCSKPCPNCGGMIVVVGSGRFSDKERDLFNRMQESGLFVISPVEEVAENHRRKRDENRLRNPDRFRRVLCP